jgi:drug/metabolite transporter (DMT)-like permease
MNIAILKAAIPASSRNKGLLAALLGSLMISFDPVFIRLSGTGGFDTAFLFGLFTAISMTAFIQATDKRGLTRTLKAGGWPLVLSALLMVGSATTFVLSVKHTAVANTMVIMSGRPVLTAVFAWLLLREKTSKKLMAAITGVVFGIAIVVTGSLESAHLIGDGFAILIVIFLAMNGVLMRRCKEMSRMAIVGLCGFFMAVIMVFPAHPSSYTLSTWVVMGVMGLVSAPLGRVLNAISPRYIPAAESAAISMSSMMLAPIWIFFVFSERPPTATFLGGAIVLSTIFAYIYMTRQRN